MSNTINTTTIIGGKYRGKKLLLPRVLTTRSSKSRLKESFFNVLQFEIVDANFVEMFAGSGGVGLEALSRGAKEIFFLEYNKSAYDTLLKNINALEPKKCKTYFGDSFLYIYKVIEYLQQKEQKAYFYIDPPFNIREGMEDIYKKVLRVIEDIPKAQCEMIIIEHSTKVVFDKQIKEYKQIKSKKFGKTTLSYYQ